MIFLPAPALQVQYAYQVHLLGADAAETAENAAEAAAQKTFEQMVVDFFIIISYLPLLKPF